jgi:hypothetical protein
MSFYAESHTQFSSADFNPSAQDKFIGAARNSRQKTKQPFSGCS